MEVRKKVKLILKTEPDSPKFPRKLHPLGAATLMTAYRNTYQRSMGLNWIQ
nr:hypothetical protein [uncultured bacterium]